jgi:hypothetical protein
MSGLGNIETRTFSCMSLQGIPSARKIHAPATETLLQESKFQDGKQLEKGRRYYASSNSGLIF